MSWTFGRRIALGFAIAFLLLLVIGAVAYGSIEALSSTSHRVAHTHQVLERTATLVGQITAAETGERGFVIAGDEAYLQPYQDAVGDVMASLKELRELTVDNPAQQQRLQAMEPLVSTRLGQLARVIEARRQRGADAAMQLIVAGTGKRTMDELRRLAEEMEQAERTLLRQRAGEVEAIASGSRQVIIGGTVLCLLFVAAAGIVLTRMLATQIAAAVQHVQRSSTELQAGANQQAAGARESATSMNEITTTMSELLASARQIAASAQRVAGAADQTAGATRSSEAALARADESLLGIRRQVDVIVDHMLGLGRKSQQIGAVLDIVSELAEQTNILAINATIEAVGAGDAGRRFAVVADEIRKLADRVAGSAKEIRALVDDVRSAVNTTVMATETGSKSVDDGTRVFAELAAAFRQIASLIGTTTDAAREIELSTKQQSSAVEQVNAAIAATAQATKETETSLAQTYQTASQLSSLSRELLLLVRRQAA